LFQPIVCECISDHSHDNDRPRVTRRRLLIAGGSGVGVLGAGGLYVASELQGDFGDYTAPDSAPAITTRGRVDPESDDSATATVDGEVALDGADELVLFVHGFATDDATARDQAYAMATGLESRRPIPVVAYSWDSDLDWEPAKAMADANAAPLAEWLTEWADEDGRPVHVVGYSLGARITGEALRLLADRDRTDAVASVSLFGGAVPNETVGREGRYGAAIAAVDAPVTNFHNADDRVLGWIYRLSDRTQAVGQTGLPESATAPAGYEDVDVTESVPDHYSYFQPEEGCLPAFVDQLP
jgi:esterase/lipase superfamily enzyme